MSEKRTDWGSGIRRTMYAIDSIALMQCMLSKKLNMTALAKKIGISKQALSEKIRTRRIISVRGVEQIEAALEVPRNYWATLIFKSATPEEAAEERKLRHMVSGVGRWKRGTSYLRSGQFIVVDARDGEKE